MLLFLKLHIFQRKSVVAEIYFPLTHSQMKLIYRILDVKKIHRNIFTGGVHGIVVYIVGLLRFGDESKATRTLLFFVCLVFHE